MSDANPKISRQGSPRLLYVGSSHEAFFRGLVRGAGSLGFEHCGYVIGVPLQWNSWQFVMMNNFPRSWQERYRRHGFCTIDPTIRHARKNVSPLTWSHELFDTEALTDLSKEARAIGFNHGWTRSFRDSNGKFGALTLARSQGVITAEEAREKQSMLQWLALAAHTVLFPVLLARHQNESLAKLTLREIDFLQLASQGKTAAEMAEAMNITERTANFHICNAMEKLGVSNKTHAVALAMRLGLLD